MFGDSAEFIKKTYNKFKNISYSMDIVDKVQDETSNARDILEKRLSEYFLGGGKQEGFSQRGIITDVSEDIKKYLSKSKEEIGDKIKEYENNIESAKEELKTGDKDS
jgi:gas vesicle protein